MHRKHLSKDPKMKEVMAEFDEVKLVQSNKVYLRLCRSIIGQQLSSVVARVIYKRFLDLYNGKEPSMKQILSTPDEALRSIGLSANKSAYIRNVCSFFSEHPISDKEIGQMSDDELIALLTQIKGVGRWTAEMILMFTLAREDVFPLDDLGIRKAMMKLYEIEEPLKPVLNVKLTQIAQVWSPYRTFACMYLWMWYEQNK